MDVCRFCHQSFPDRNAFDRHACPMGGAAVKPPIGIQSILLTFAELAAVSLGTWLFVTRGWGEDLLGAFEKVVNPGHVRIANGVAALLFAVVWWSCLRFGFWVRGMLVLLALAVWAATLPAVRAAFF
jgi:hypothetical protein